MQRNCIKCCKMFDDCIWKGLQPVNDLQGHSHCRWCHLIGYIRFPINNITLICQKLRRHVPVTTPTWGQYVITRLILLGPTRAQNLMILFSAIPEKFKGCKILKWIMWQGPHLFQGWSVIRRLTLDIAWKLTKFDDLKPFQGYFRGDEILHCVSKKFPLLNCL